MVLFYNHSVSPILTTITKNVKSNQYPKIKTDSEVKTLNRENNVETTTKNIQGHVTKKEIVLSEDIELKDRLNLYKKFLHYCVTGNVIELGLGSVITLEHEQKEFGYLKQLGTILGLSQLEISEVHQSMAESAFKMQAQSILTESNPSKEKMGQIEDLRKKLGISDTDANEILRNIRINKIQEKCRQETMSLSQILELSQHGTKVEDIVSEKIRMKIFRHEVETVMSDGTGTYDAHKFTVLYPNALRLDPRKALTEVEEIASDKFRKSFVQAISFFRHKKYSELKKTVQNMVSQYRAFPNSVSWEKKDEINRLYEMYLRQTNSSTLHWEAAKALGIPKEEAEKIKEIVTSTKKESMMIQKNEDRFDYFH